MDKPFCCLPTEPYELRFNEMIHRILTFYSHGHFCHLHFSFSLLSVPGYLFPEIARRRTAYLKEHPEMDGKIISLGIGDTTQPIPPHILSGLVTGSSKLGTKEGYSGYGAEQGMGPLREKIAKVLYNGRIQPDEVFVTDNSASMLPVYSERRLLLAGRRSLQSSMTS